jgi:hypothetical protein
MGILYIVRNAAYGMQMRVYCTLEILRMDSMSNLPFSASKPIRQSDLNPRVCGVQLSSLHRDKTSLEFIDLLIFLMEYNSQ